MPSDASATVPAIPSDLCCPISQHVMRRPVRIETGHVFDEASILAWFEAGGPICPLTRATVDPDALEPCPDILSNIATWLKQHDLLRLWADESTDQVLPAIEQHIDGADSKPHICRYLLPSAYDPPSPPMKWLIVKINRYYILNRLCVKSTIIRQDLSWHFLLTATSSKSQPDIPALVHSLRVCPDAAWRCSTLQVLVRLAWERVSYRELMAVHDVIPLALHHLYHGCAQARWAAAELLSYLSLVTHLKPIIFAENLACRTAVLPHLPSLASPSDVCRMLLQELGRGPHQPPQGAPAGPWTSLQAAESRRTEWDFALMQGFLRGTSGEASAGVFEAMGPPQQQQQGPLVSVSDNAMWALWVLSIDERVRSQLPLAQTSRLLLHNMQGPSSSTGSRVAGCRLLRSLATTQQSAALLLQKEPLIDLLQDMLLPSKEAVERAAAAATLCNIVYFSQTRALSTLHMLRATLSMLRSQDSGTQQWGARLLKTILTADLSRHLSGAVGPLCNMLMGDPDEMTFEVACSALVAAMRCGGDDTRVALADAGLLKLLTAALTKSAIPAVRARALGALSVLPSPHTLHMFVTDSVTDVLVHTLSSSGAHEQRHMAASTLLKACRARQQLDLPWRCSDVAAVCGLLKLLSSGEEHHQWTAAALLRYLASVSDNAGLLCKAGALHALMDAWEGQTDSPVADEALHALVTLARSSWVLREEVLATCSPNATAAFVRALQADRY